jgi:hypothetical protein
MTALAGQRDRRPIKGLTRLRIVEQDEVLLVLDGALELVRGWCRRG